MSKQFLCDLVDSLILNQEKLTKRKYSQSRRIMASIVEYFDSDASEEIDYSNVVACKIFLSCFSL